LLGRELTNRTYPQAGVPEPHHAVSHHGNVPATIEKHARINTYHLTLLARFLEKLRTTPDGDGSLLDHSMIVYGSGISDGNAHNHDELPVLLAGRGAGTLETGRHVRYKPNTPLNNLYLSLLDRMDSNTDTLGDSTGRLPYLRGESRSF